MIMNSLKKLFLLFLTFVSSCSQSEYDPFSIITFGSHFFMSTKSTGPINPSVYYRTVESLVHTNVLTYQLQTYDSWLMVGVFFDSQYAKSYLDDVSEENKTICIRRRLTSRPDLTADVIVVDQSIVLEMDYEEIINGFYDAIYIYRSLLFPMDIYSKIRLIFLLLSIIEPRYLISLVL